MELLKKVETWWESLGISEKDGRIVDNLLNESEIGRRTDHPLCENCTNRIDPNNIHDCRGVYDEVRYHLKEKSAPRSHKNRLSKKYNCLYGSDEMDKKIEEYRLKNEIPFAVKIGEYKALRQNKVLQAKMLEYNWEEEEELWNT